MLIHRARLSQSVVQMKHTVKNWAHAPGVHCGSTALSNLMSFHGRPLSEAMCFGLGAGLGVYYLKTDIFSPSRTIATRSAGLESEFFNSIGVNFSWEMDPDNASAWRKVKNFIDRDLPVVLQTDIFYLDYYNSKTHFNGHVVLAWGYDEEAGKAFLSDTGWQGLNEVPLASLEKARISPAPPFPLENNFFALEKLPASFNIESAVRQSLKKQAEEMLREEGAFGFSGVGAMKSISADLASWKDAHDWKWCARFSYQVIEKRGTGGGAFRLLYSRFLSEAEKLLPELKGKKLPERMKEIAGKWTELGGLLKEISDSDHPVGFAEAGDLAGDIAEMEEAYYKDVLKLV